MRNPLEESDAVYRGIASYLNSAGWTPDDSQLFVVDPLTGTRHNQHTALTIQFDRDISSKKS